ncbi:Gfo/Idh/MocA family oxidoreductase [candidate division KSB1 bacterium]|nr:Gfo/Idh/MocA family oxidoreductase [candidate division KSB1 bacterium]
MSTIKLPVIIHGVTGRMGQIALRALQLIASKGLTVVDGARIEPVPIGLGRNLAKMQDMAKDKGLHHFFAELDEAVVFARKINPEKQVYHNTVATGIRRGVVLEALPHLDSSTWGVYMEKPLAANYADGFAIVDALEKGGFIHGVVHHMLSTPGLRKAMELLPEIKPLSAQMLFGYEVGSGLGGNPEFSGQRPDFNWTLEQAGGGIILDMCHEGYLSQALFGETEALSCIARLVVPQRLSTDGKTIIDCDVEDYSQLTRQHANGVVNTSVWSWYRRVNSEFGPLEITIDGEGGSLVFGLYGLKVQWKETAPANRWEKSVSGEKTEWRDHWQYVEMDYQDPFAFELAEYLGNFMKGETYRRNAIQALNILSEVEAQYSSAANGGKLVKRDEMVCYPTAPVADWKPERLQGKLTVVKSL